MVEYFAGKNVKLFFLTIRKWKTLQELIRVLRIPYDATIALQSPTITVSDCFGIWTKMTLLLEACASKNVFKTGLAQKLITALNNRKKPIFDTPEMQCSLFLDPRFRRFVLNDRDQTERAKAYAVSIWNRINSLQSNSSSNDELENKSSEFHVSIDEQAELNRFMGQASTSHQQNQLNGLSHGIEDELELFQPDLLPSEKSILEFWQNQKQSLLYNVAMTVYSIPPTQVKIEQNFSSVGHVFTDRRFNLSCDRLRDILMIHLNKDVFQMIKNEELSKIIT